ncbi:glycosyltransferase [Aliamphritea ceti]|uniref:glycosyltransferase n=1 Tax=Aliamphritea ceti TaxID=1524258 RepID=UPI0021C474B3|nr:glycosyltransferase [Aliamphritea ceti]
MNIDMLVFGEDWGEHPSSTQHLITQLLPEQQILWINSLGLRRPRLNSADLRRAWHKISKMISQQKQNEALGRASDQSMNPLSNQLQILNPRAISWPGNPLARSLSSQLLKRQILPLLNASANQSQKAKSPLLWTSLPSAVDVVGKLNERACVYYCCDDFSALDGVDHGPVSRMEQELAQKSQLIITASSKLAAKFPDHKTWLLPHGVDTSLFSSPAPRADDLPSDGPVAGFYGSLAGWFDQRLFTLLAKLLPHWTFVLIGPAKTDISALLEQPNIRWLGSKPHHELPRYSQHWDVSLLPFLQNPQIKACNPLKLREYLAAGSPIVSTDFPALDGYRDLVKVSHSAAGFAEELEAIYRNRQNLKAIRTIRQQRVEKESWQQRGKELKSLLDEL